MTESRALTKPQIVSQLTKSPHGDLSAYVEVGTRASRDDPEFFAHLIAWNAQHGQVRDAKVALPVIGLVGTFDRWFVENALAHIAKLPPRDFLRALDFARTVQAPDRTLRRLTSRYLRETDSWEPRALRQHRRALKRLWARSHKKSDGSVAFFEPVATRDPFVQVRALKVVGADDAVLLLKTGAFPFVVARGALGAAASDPAVLAALIKSMSPTEVTTNLKWLKGRGATDEQIAAALKKVAKAPKANLLKASRAAEAVEDPALKAAVQAAQEQQLDAAGGIKGRWLVLADKSGSMSSAIAAARQVAAIIARTAETVDLVFFDSSPRHYDVTGKSLAEISEATKHVRADGGTSIGCGMSWALDRDLIVDGVAIVSDAGENETPFFGPAYKLYAERTGATPSVYLYLVGASMGMAVPFLARCKPSEVDVQTFDLGGGFDYYSLPNLTATMRASRYGLLDEIMATTLLTLDGTMTRTVGQRVLPKPQSEAVEA